MSIATEITRLNTNKEALATAKTAIASAITTKGGTVASGDGFADFATDISSIPSGGGTLLTSIDFSTFSEPVSTITVDLSSYGVENYDFIYFQASDITLSENTFFNWNANTSKENYYNRKVVSVPSLLCALYGKSNIGMIGLTGGPIAETTLFTPRIFCDAGTFVNGVISIYGCKL